MNAIVAAAADQLFEKTKLRFQNRFIGSFEIELDNLLPHLKMIMIEKWNYESFQQHNFQDQLTSIIFDLAKKKKKTYFVDSDS